MSNQILTLSDAASTNTLLEFVSTYFPFIDDPLKLTYRGRIYKIITTQVRKFAFEDFFMSRDCSRCRANCCKNMYIPIGFEQLWSEEKLKELRRFKPRRYKVQFNGQQFIYYIGSVDRGCKFQAGRSCTIWDSDKVVQNRPMGCHFYPMTWYWDEGTIIFTKHCDPFLCTAESIKYTEEDYLLDLKTFEKLAKEIETVGWTVNYRPIEALKEQHYLTI